MPIEDYISYRRLAFLFVIIGFLFAIDYMSNFNLIHKLWPIILSIEGIGLIFIYMRSRDGKSIFLGVGEYLTLFSILALYCNFYSWTNLKILWPLFISFLGITFLTIFFFHNKNRFILFLGLFFFFLSLFFFLLLFFGSHIWWVIFIFIGLSILLTIKRT